MATDARGHTVPAGSDVFDPQGSDVALSLSIRDAIPVANVTARAALITTLAGLGITPSTANPIKVWRADAPVGAQEEITTNGTTWMANAIGDAIRGMWVQSSPIAIASGTFMVIPAVTAVGTPDASLSNSGGAITLGVAGSYGVTVSTLWNGTGGTRRMTILTLNGAWIDGGGNVGSSGSVIGSDQTSPGSVDHPVTVQFPPFTAAAGDVLRAFVFQDAGAPLSLNAGTDTNYLGRTAISVQHL